MKRNLFDSLIKSYLSRHKKLSGLCKLLKHGKYPNLKSYVNQRFSDIPENMFTLKEVFYRIMNDIEIRPVCPVCKKPVIFVGSAALDRLGKTLNGYRRHCCLTCSNKDNMTKEKQIKTFSLKFNVRNPQQNEVIRNKTEQTNLKRYGFRCSLQNEEVKERSKKTCLEKYGVEHSLQNETVKEKAKSTCLKLYYNKIY